jgi:molybdopterin-guanine dinucleotide biosynthesis protein A
MGRPKVSLPHPSGGSMLDHVAQTLTHAGHEPILVGAGAHEGQSGDLLQIDDLPHMEGPLGGLLAALEHDPDSAWLIAACDLPAMDGAAISWLIEQRAPGLAAILPRLGPSGVEPLLAIYEPAAAPMLHALARAGRRSPKALALEEKVGCPRPPQSLHGAWTNLNTPQEWRAYWRQVAGVSPP